MDTKYFEQAMLEFCMQRSMHIKVGDLTTGELCRLLQRAQELKKADQERQAQVSRGPVMQPVDSIGM
jgi:hypothetical protein